MDTFGDPGWFHHQQIAQVWGLNAVRLATAPVVAFNATLYTEELKTYLNSLSAEIIESANGDVDIAKTHVNLGPLEDAVDGLAKFASRLDAKAQDLVRNPSRRSCYFNVFCLSRHRTKEVEEVNKAYLRFERSFIGNGLPGRPIYKHVVYAPGSWEGYAGFTFPSIREAIAEGHWSEARGQVKEITRLLKKATGHKCN
jgi:N-acetylated-alpha-linked acidic dipeptidase